MATLAGSIAVTATLTAAEVDEVTLAPGFNIEEVSVSADAASVPVYFTIDGDPPTVGGDCYRCPPGGAVNIADHGRFTHQVVVRLIASLGVTYHVAVA